MEDEELYAHLKELTRTIPTFEEPVRDPVDLEWLGRLHAVVKAGGDKMDAIQLRVASDSLGTIRHDQNVSVILNALYRTLASVEGRLPVAARGAFIAPGNAYDAVAAVGRILSEAQKGILVVDPYLGDKVLETFAVFAAERVPIALLGAEGRTKPTLLPAARAWVQQYGQARPLDVRLAPAVRLHDRLIIVDEVHVWGVSQSFQDLAARAHATLSKADAEMAPMTVAAYIDIFATADVQPLQ